MCALKNCSFFTQAIAFAVLLENCRRAGRLFISHRISHYAILRDGLTANEF